MLAGLSARAWVALGLLLGATFVIGAIWSNGREFERAKNMAEEAQDMAAGAVANTKTANAVAVAADQIGAAGAGFIQEAANARREIETHEALPAPGTVGAGALVDPAVGRPLLCRIERLRGIEAGPACADAAAHGFAPGDTDGRDLR